MPEQKKPKPARLQSPGTAEMGNAPPGLMQKVMDALGMSVPQGESEWVNRLDSMPGIGPMAGTTVGPKALPLGDNLGYLKQVMKTMLGDVAETRPNLPQLRPRMNQSGKVIEALEEIDPLGSHMSMTSPTKNPNRTGLHPNLPRTAGQHVDRLAGIDKRGIVDAVTNELSRPGAGMSLTDGVNKLKDPESYPLLMNLLDALMNKFPPGK